MSGSIRLGSIRLNSSWVRSCSALVDSATRVSKRRPIARSDPRSRDTWRAASSQFTKRATRIEQAFFSSLFSRPFINKRPLRPVPLHGDTRSNLRRAFGSACPGPSLPVPTVNFRISFRSRSQRGMLRCRRPRVTAHFGRSAEEDRPSLAQRSRDKKTFEKKIVFSRILNEVRRICCKRYN